MFEDEKILEKFENVKTLAILMGYNINKKEKSRISFFKSNGFQAIKFIIDMINKVNYSKNKGYTLNITYVLKKHSIDNSFYTTEEKIIEVDNNQEQIISLLNVLQNLL